MKYIKLQPFPAANSQGHFDKLHPHNEEVGERVATIDFFHNEMKSGFDLMQHDLLTAQIEYQIIPVKFKPCSIPPLVPIVLLKP